MSEGPACSAVDPPAAALPEVSAISEDPEALPEPMGPHMALDPPAPAYSAVDPYSASADAFSTNDGPAYVPSIETHEPSGETSDDDETMVEPAEDDCGEYAGEENAEEESAISKSDSESLVSYGLSASMTAEFSPATAALMTAKLNQSEYLPGNQVSCEYKYGWISFIYLESNRIESYIYIYTYIYIIYIYIYLNILPYIFMLDLQCGALLLLRHRFLSAQSNLYNSCLRCHNS